MKLSLSLSQQHFLFVFVLCLVALLLTKTVSEAFKINTHNNQIYMETEEDKFDQIFQRKQKECMEQEQQQSSEPEQQSNTPDINMNKDDISELNDDMKLYYTVFDNRSYVGGRDNLKDISYHHDKYKIEGNQNKIVDFTVNRDAKFYGNTKPTFSNEMGLDLSSTTVSLPPSYQLGIDTKNFTVLFYGRFNKPTEPKGYASRNRNFMTLYGNTSNNIGLSIEVQPSALKDKSEGHFVVNFENGSQIRTYGDSKQKDKSNILIKHGDFYTYAFVFDKKGMTFYQGEYKEFFPYKKQVKSVFLSNKRAVLNRLRNLNMDLKTFSIQNKALSEDYIRRYDAHMKKNEVLQSEQMKKMLQKQDAELKNIKTAEEQLRSELEKVRECPFVGKSDVNDPNPCDKECKQVVWSGQILGENPLNPACANRVVKYCSAQEEKEPVCKCFDIEFAQDNAYCADQLETLYYLSDIHERSKPTLSKEVEQKLNTGRDFSLNEYLKGVFEEENPDIQKELKKQEEYKKSLIDISTIGELTSISSLY